MFISKSSEIKQRVVLGGGGGLYQLIIIYCWCMKKISRDAKSSLLCY